MAVQRMTGLASGMDYETIIKNLMKAEKAPVDKLQQQKQIYEWQKETYRELNTSIFALKDEAFNMKLSSSYKIFNTSSSDTTVVTSTGVDSASDGTYKVKVRQLAATAEKKSAATVSPLLQSTANITDFNISGKDLYVTFDGIQKHISWGATEGNYANVTDLKNGLQAKIDNAFGSNQITVTVSGDKIALNPTDTTFKPNISLNSGTTIDALTQLKFSSGAQSHISLDTQLQDLGFINGALTFDTDDKLKFTINGSSIEVNKTDTLNTLFSKVNNDLDADVVMGYDSAKDTIFIRRKSSGAGKDITLTDGTGSNFSTAVGFGATVPGTNSIVDFIDNNGVETLGVEKSSNSFSIAGVNLNLLKADATEYKSITVTKDVDAVYNKIKSFIDKYNEIIDNVNTKLKEKREYDYVPLTDEQKESMKDTDVENWEAKAKSGLVKGDTILEGIVRDLRNSMNNEIPGLSSNYNQLSEFGITTGSYTENGKLHVDETKLKQVISEHSDEVLSFFSFNPPNLKGNVLNASVDVDNKDFKLTVNGATETITLAGTYDLSTAEGKSNLLKELNDKISGKFGYNQVIASLNSENRIVFSSPGGYSFTLNSGTTNDALATLGFVDGNNYDASRKGIMSKVYDKLTIGVKKLVEKAGVEGYDGYFDGSLIGEQLKRLDKRIEDANNRLTEIEDRYYKQFTAMETALNKMNSQSAWLAQQTGSSS